MNEEIEELKKEATELGISYSPNIGIAKLQSKIDERYASQETSAKELEDAIKANENPEEKSAESGKVSAPSKPTNAGKKTIAQIKAIANKTSVVTIIDNDQRVNNQTSTCTVNCSNMYFDLGTLILPLNLAVEVRQGHLNVLKENKIPQHVKDPRTNLSSVRMVPRYTISYEQNQNV